MQCMKCGLEIPEGQVFCDGCLEVMDKYPVSPDTPVHILPRKAVEKTQKKRELSPKEQLRRQKRTIRRLKGLVLILVIALACVAGLLLLWTLFPDYDFFPGVTRPF